MKVVQINMVPYGSTGNIMNSIAQSVRKSGNECYTFSMGWKGQKKREGHFYIGTYLENAIHQVFGKIFGLGGLFSIFGTCGLIRKLKKINPDVIHIHNLHNSYVCIPLLVRYLKKSKKPVLFTLHDCWTFTGKCPHYLIQKCEKWKTGCHHCPDKKTYPRSYIDSSKFMWKKKKKWFSSLTNLTIITPSQWLANEVKKSFLRDKPVLVINNGIDLDVFKPIPMPQNEFFVLGVSSNWSFQKGLDVFIDLAKTLPESIKIVMVGVDENTKAKLPSNIVAIEKTNSKEELASLYSQASVFLNPTREDTFPTVNMEAIACGTPVITFQAGGSSEIVHEGCGLVVQNFDEMKNAILSVYNREIHFDKQKMQEVRTLFDQSRSIRLYENFYRSAVEHHSQL